ncbi:Hypothetical predicted protein [Lecanosticta acicola]|uniref:Peroxisomal trans-2-enoyl-CoA reductase n=1 Tax=Lecanosticta acicola TaxID=111012 RepID=A0AAI8Z7E9_9PEZI|nr:Hypothetical predicted protein [Lecanosticta acicola]
MATMNGREPDSFSPYRADGKLLGFVCIVTGATQPVGRAIVAELAAHGAACVYACSPTPKDDYTSLEQEVKKQHPDSNTKIIGYPFKLANEEDTLTLIDDILNAWGRLDIWVTSSGFIGPSSISQTTPADVYKTFEAIALAPFFALKYAPPAMSKTSPRKPNYANAAPKPQPYGSIIVISSIASQIGGCWGPAFTMSSHAALGVVRAGVATLKGTGVRVNCISAGQIDNGVDLQSLDEQSHQLPPSSLQSKEVQKQQIGLERAGLPNEVARTAGFLASGFSSYITGTNIVVDGGSSAMNPLTVPMV